MLAALFPWLPWWRERRLARKLARLDELAESIEIFTKASALWASVGDHIRSHRSATSADKAAEEHATLKAKP